VPRRGSAAPPDFPGQCEVGRRELGDADAHAARVRTEIGGELLELALPRAAVPAQAFEPDARLGTEVRDEVAVHARDAAVRARREDVGVPDVERHLERPRLALVLARVRAPGRQAPRPRLAGEPHERAVERHVDRAGLPHEQRPGGVVHAHLARFEQRGPVREAHARLDRAESRERIAADVAHVEGEVAVLAQRAVEEERELARDELGAIHEEQDGARDAEDEQAREEQQDEARELADGPADGFRDVLDDLLDDLLDLLDQGLDDALGLGVRLAARVAGVLHVVALRAAKSVGFAGFVVRVARIRTFVTHARGSLAGSETGPDRELEGERLLSTEHLRTHELRVLAPGEVHPEGTKG
jgi:hypothetical protein